MRACVHVVVLIEGKHSCQKEAALGMGHINEGRENGEGIGLGSATRLINMCL